MLYGQTFKQWCKRKAYPTVNLTIGRSLSIQKVTYGLFRTETNHDAQIVLCRDIKQVYGRNGVLDANGVDTVARHHGEIGLDLATVVILESGLVRPKRTVVHTL